jgi:hypothetical protein
MAMAIATLTITVREGGVFGIGTGVGGLVGALIVLLPEPGLLVVGEVVVEPGLLVVGVVLVEPGLLVVVALVEEAVVLVVLVAACVLVVGVLVEVAVILGAVVGPGELVGVICLSSKAGESGSACATGLATAKCMVVCSSTLMI